MDNFITDTAERIFNDHAEDSGSLWSALEENGLTRAWAPERLGGTGLELSDGYNLIRQSGKHAINTPFSETLMASFLLSTVDTKTPDGPITICTSMENNHVEAPFTHNAKFMLRLNAKTLELCSLDNTDENHTSKIGSSDLKVEQSIAAPAWITADVFMQFGALVRTAQLCGAMEKQLELTLEHTRTREQFGRPLTKFQAVQHLLSDMAGELASSTAALTAATHSVSLDTAPDFMAIASAKIRASEAAEIVTKNAHQAHGAIGFTDEYALGQFSRRLWRWRDDFGNEHFWGKRLGEHIMRPDSNGLVADIFGETNAKC